MKKILFGFVLPLAFLFSALLAVSGKISAQIFEPVKWSFSSKVISDTEAELLLTASMDKGWHLYSQYVPEGGPLPTIFHFEPSPEFKPIGKVIEPKAIEAFDPNFDMVVKYFGGKAVFKQKIKLQTKNDFKVTGYLEFMCCDDKRCLPPQEIEFSIPVKLKDIANNTENDSQADVESPEKQDTADASQIVSVEVIESNNTGTTDSLVISDETSQFEGMSLWLFFLTAFLGGLIALLTPCIYPMIPITVSFFLHNAGNKRKSRLQATVYGLSIVLIYVLVGTVVAVTLGEQFTNFLSTHWIPNVFFFVLFMVFAAAFFGMFDLTLPSWMVSKTDKQADRGGYIGAFFMAFTLVLVSFSCTAPIAGTILAFSTQGMVLKPVVGMLGYSLAFAIPFTLFAIFPSALNNLPKSGGWLNSVKVVLGFLELALGLKFLSVADQTYHWGLLDREVYIAIWIVIFTLMGIYLLGKIKFAHDSDVKYLSVPRLLLAVVTFSFVVYLIPGMFGAPLKALSGWLPPQTTHDFDIGKIVRENAFMVQDAIYESGSRSAHTRQARCEEPKYADQLHLPHSLKGYYDMEQALACAKAQNKPLFLDFTGHGCVNCREMEANVWSSPEVLKRLRNDFVIVALYVDDKRIQLAEEDWYVSTYDGKTKKTLGDKNWDFQKTRFNANAQPYYVLLDHNLELLSPPRGYSLNVNEFIRFLDNGLEEFKRKNK